MRRRPNRFRSARVVRATANAVLVALAVLLAPPGACHGASAGTGGRELAARHGFAPADVGFLLFDPADGRVVDEHNAEQPFIPASTTKVATALAALEVLGGDFRFATTLHATGLVAGGVLSGDLYLRGGGDPTLTSDGLRRLVADLRAAGVTRVDGAFFYDESLFPRASEIDVLQPEAATYNPVVDALAVNYNRVVLRWKREAKARKPATTIVSPADGGALPVHGLVTGTLEPGLDPRIEFAFAPGAEPRWLLSPRLPPTGSAELPVKTQPGGLAADLFRTLATRAGIELPAPLRGAVPDDARTVAQLESAPLVEVVTGLLRFSNNLTAELTGLATSRRLTGEGLSLRASAERVARWWQDRLPATSFRDFLAANHSGLSSVTQHTPRQMAAILRHGWTAHATAPRLPDLLRTYTAGADEDAREPRDGAPRVRAKSGTLLYADGLAGYLTTRRGRDLGFVVLLTDRAARSRLDATRDVRVGASPPEATDWTARAKAFERDLIAAWAADG